MPFTQSQLDDLAARYTAACNSKVPENVAAFHTADDADAFMGHLLGSVIDPFRKGQQYTVGQWIMVAGGLPGAPSGLCDGFSTDSYGQEQRRAKANEMLSLYGLRVTLEQDGPVLCVANTGPSEQRRLFERTQWAGGSWKQSAARMPGAVKSRTTKSFSGTVSRCVMIPVVHIPALNAFPDNPARQSGRGGTFDDDVTAGFE